MQNVETSPNNDLFMSQPAGVLVTQDNVFGIPAFYAGVRLLADSISTLPSYLTDELQPGAKIRPDWMRFPNITSTSVDLWSDVMTSLAVDGNAFVLCVVDMLTGDPVELHVLDPRLVVMRRDKLGVVTFCVPLDQNGTRYADVPPVSRFTEVGVLHIVGIRRTGWMRGISVVAECREALGISVASGRFQASIFKNSATPQGVLEVSTQLDDGEARQLLRNWKLSKTGPGRAGLPALLSGGAQWKSVSMSPADMQLLELNQYAVKECARMLRIPGWLLETENSTSYASTEQAMLSFAQNTVRPWVVRIEEAFARILPEGVKLNFSIEAMLRADTAARFDAFSIALQNGIMSPNEVRAELGLTPVDGGEVLYRQLNLTPLDPPEPPVQPLAPAVSTVPSEDPNEPEPPEPTNTGDPTNEA
jgi:HK97 family phage portal protein